MRDYKPNWVDYYNKVLDDKGLRHETMMFENEAANELEKVKEKNKPSILPSEKLRQKMREGRATIEKRQEFFEAVKEFP